MTVAKAVVVLGATLSGLSLLVLVLGFAAWLVVSLRTAAGALRRSRSRRSGLGPLALAFPARRIAELDEALERAALDLKDPGTTVPT